MQNFLWERIQQHMDDPKHRYAPKPADLARETGVSEQLLSKWKSKPMMPRAEHLLAFASGTGIPYEELVVAMLKGQMYLSDRDTSTRLVLHRRNVKVLRRVGAKLAEQLLLAQSQQDRRPIDLSDVFAESDEWSYESQVERPGFVEALTALDGEPRLSESEDISGSDSLGRSEDGKSQGTA